MLNRVGFEPTPFRTSDTDVYSEDITLSWRLRPLGHLSDESNFFDEGMRHAMFLYAITSCPSISTTRMASVTRYERMLNQVNAVNESSKVVRGCKLC
jgi:hypothetical protein